MKRGNHFLRQWCTVLSLVICASIAGAALAQPYPNKPIRIIVPAQPGGTSGLIAITLGQKFTEAWGQQCVIDYRGGAGGNIAAELTAKAPPDGYTLHVIAGSFVINPSLYTKIPYVLKDFAPVTQVTSQVFFLLVHPAVQAKTVKEFIEFAKSKKGGIVYASGGTGTPTHLGMELLKTLAGFEGQHVPYQGAGPAFIDLFAGRVEVFMAAPSGLPHVKSGKLRAIAATGLKRSVLLPDLPTVAESVPGFEVIGFQGLVAPAGTPREVVAKLHGEILRSLKAPEVRERLLAIDVEPVGSTPEEFTAYLQAEITKWAKVVKQAGARVD